MLLALPQDLFQIGQGDAAPILVPGGAVLGEQEIGVADEVALIGVDDLIAVSARRLEICLLYTSCVWNGGS